MPAHVCLGFGGIFARLPFGGDVENNHLKVVDYLGRRAAHSVVIKDKQMCGGDVKWKTEELC